MENDEITAMDLTNRMSKESVCILDVRTPEERVLGYIEGSKNINFYGKDFRSEIEKLNRSKNYVVYCASGGRSSKTIQMMKEIGFTNCYNLSGGFGEWEKSGMKILI